MKLAPEKDGMVQAFARAVEQAGGKALLVGGIVRDELLGLPSKDFDFEVFGLPMEKVNEILKQFGNVKEVGESFGVLHINELDWDVALPRRERKTGEGHKGFDVVPDPTMSIEEAARRRDLTINAMSKDPLTGEVIDPLGGVHDIENGILRMADPNTFGDDPLRALRVAQFAARFDFDVEPETLKVVAAQPLEELPGERILPEFSKMLLKGKVPSKGIETLRQANLLRYFPEIEALQGVPQDKIHHPEGDVYVHTLMVLDEAAKQRTGDAAFDLPLMLGALAHDFGKPEFTQHVEDRIKSHGHEEGGMEPTRDFMNRMKAPNDLTKQVVTLVGAHLRPQLMAGTGGRKGYRKLGRHLQAAGVSPELLAAVSKADSLGRTTDSALRRDTSRQDLFLQEYNEHVTSVAEPGGKLQDSVTGKDLIARGMKPGPDMGKFLKLTREIEDETGITDPDKLIELATRFLSDRAEGPGNSDEPANKCGDSHIRDGEKCYDGDYRAMRKKGLTDSSLASNLDWTVSRPCGDDEKYPDKCNDDAFFSGDEVDELGRQIDQNLPSGPAPQFDQNDLREWEMETDMLLPETPREQQPEPAPVTPDDDAWELPPEEPLEFNDPNAPLTQEPPELPEDTGPEPGPDAWELPPEETPQPEAPKETAPPPIPEDKPAADPKRKGMPSNWKDILKYILQLDQPEEEKMQSAMGPSHFRTHPNPDETDFALWKEFDIPPHQKGKALHPGLATTAEPQRQHERSIEWTPKGPEVGTRFSDRPVLGPGSRDGFGGSTPPLREEKDPRVDGPTPEDMQFPARSDMHGQPQRPATHPRVDGPTPEDMQFPARSDMHGQPQRPATHPHEGDHSVIDDPAIPATDPHERLGVDYLDWDAPPTSADIGPEHRGEFPGADQLRMNEYPNDKGAGYLATEKPIPQLLDTNTPHPSPMRAEETPPSSFPGQVVRKPGGGGLDRAPMIKPEGEPSGVGFQPIQNPPEPGRNMFKAENVEAKPKYGRGGQNPGGDGLMRNDHTMKGPGGGHDKSREYWDYDDTGKKAGFLYVEPPKENIYPAATEAARTLIDLMDIESIYPHDYNPEWDGGGVTQGPNMKHRNERKVHDQGLDPFPKGYGPDGNIIHSDDDANIEQKQVQPLIPNQKMAIAVDPKGPMGERIVIMSPLFEEASPAIMALRSHRFERHGGIVVDGPPEWLLGVTPRLEALDKSSGMEGADDLFERVKALIQAAGLPVEYEQEPRP